MEFSAGSQALGYLYQVRCALDLLLSNPDETMGLLIESLDDVVFEDNGTPRELLQLKHHGTRAALTDTSSDLWKTIRIWSTHLHEGRLHLPDTVLSLITTGQAPTDSIAALLRPNTDRDARHASRRLYEVTTQSSNQALRSSFTAFTTLSPQQRDLLVNSIQIIDNYPNIDDVVGSIKKRLLSVRRQHREGLYERLEGWWFDKVIRHLREKSLQPITGFDVQDKIADLAEQFHTDSLPIDFYDAFPPTASEPDQDTRQFVHQLRVIALHNKRIENAILDYYRAFQQRARWAREELLISDELEQYEKKLVDEWERYSLALQDEIAPDEADEQALCDIGRRIYRWIELEANYPIRPRVSEPYVMRGSFHMLADQDPPRVWWHPRFVERLRTLLQES
jgi:hypothetical protein